MKKFLIASTLVLFMIQSSFAIGSLFARNPRLSTTDYKPLWLHDYNTTVTITDQMAVTHVDQTFKNETYDRLEGIFIFPLPANAVVTELALWINGVRVVGDVMEKDTARAIYNSIVRRSLDPALLEDMGNNIFKLSVFPIEAIGNTMSERRIEITYVELLPYKDGNITYAFNLKSAGLSSKPVTRLSVSTNLTTQKAITALTVPSFPNDPRIAITKLSTTKYSIIYGNENAFDEKNLAIVYQVDNSSYSMEHLTYVRDTALHLPFDSIGDNPYFCLWITPPNIVNDNQILPKNLVFVADISSSMSGSRITQLKQSLNTMVGMLTAKDKFNLVTFSTAVQSLSPNLVTADSLNKAAAFDFIATLSEIGLTNMEDALKTALSNTWQQTSANGVVFFTDGKPTWPMSSTTASVIDTVKKYNTSGVAIHTFGIGTIDTAFLMSLAKNTSGFSTVIAAEDSIVPIMSAFMKDISRPLIKNITVNYGTLSVYDAYPSILPNLYAGTQLTILGRYIGKQDARITFTGQQSGTSFQLIETVPFPASATNQPFVARMWASMKIDKLLDDIGLLGEQSELVNQVKYLGKRYSIITPYTSMLVTEPGTSTPVVQDKTQPVQTQICLFQNAPNPFIKSTLIKFSIPKLSAPEKVTLSIYDCKGRMIRMLCNEITLGGNFSAQWDGKDVSGMRSASGIYIAVLKVGNIQQLIRMKMVG